MNNRFLVLLVFFLQLMGCSKKNDVDRTESTLFSISNTQSSEVKTDVVFIHGVDGDYKSTWYPNQQPANYWPEWLGENKSIAVWSLNYPISTTLWNGSTMPLIDRARNVLGLLTAKGFHKTDRPLVFVAHSFGGLVVKQMLSTAETSPNTDWQSIGARTKGIVFVATPNTGSNVASFLEFCAGKLTTVTVKELAKSEPRLLELNRWYLRKAPMRGIKTLSFCETKRLLNWKVLVVPEDSADPNIAGSEIVPLDADHISICKPQSRESQIVLLTEQFITALFSPEGPTQKPEPPVTNESYPNEAEITAKPVFPAKDVVLEIMNETNENIELWLFDCGRHHDKMLGNWRMYPLPIGAEAKTFENAFHTDSRGWFGVFVRGGNTWSQCLRITNLFASRSPRIKVKGQNGEFSIEIQ